MTYTQICPNIQMSVNCNICSDLLGFNTVNSSTCIETHGYIATARVWLPAKFSGIIVGLNILAYLKRHQHNLNRWQETCLFHYIQYITMENLSCHRVSISHSISSTSNTFFYRSGFAVYPIHVDKKLNFTKSNYCKWLTLSSRRVPHKTDISILLCAPRWLRT